MSELSTILNKIAEGPGMKFAVLVSNDGFVVENSDSLNENDEIAGSMVSTILGAIKCVGSELQSGDAEQVLIKYKKDWLLINPINEELLLVSVLTNQANIAWVRYAIKNNIQKMNTLV